MNTIRIYVQRDNEKSFISALKEAEISYSQIQIFSTDFIAIIEIIGKIYDAAPTLINSLLVVWVMKNKNRKVTVTREKPNGQLEKLEITGYSAKDANLVIAPGDHIELSGD